MVYNFNIQNVPEQYTEFVKVLERLNHTIATDSIDIIAKSIAKIRSLMTDDVWFDNIKNTLQEIEENEIIQPRQQQISFIVELLNELDPEDEVSTEEVGRVVREKFSRIKNYEIQKILMKIGREYEEYKYVRLKNVLRKLNTVNLEIDKLWDKFDKFEGKT